MSKLWYGNIKSDKPRKRIRTLKVNCGLNIPQQTLVQTLKPTNRQNEKKEKEEREEKAC